MPNEIKLWESFDDILAHRKQWNQNHYMRGTYTPTEDVFDCGTTQCIAAFRCLRDGLVPDVGINGQATGMFRRPDGHMVYPADHAVGEFELNGDEESALFQYWTSDLGNFKHRIEEIIAGKWAEIGDRSVNEDVQ